MNIDTVLARIERRDPVDAGIESAINVAALKETHSRITSCRESTAAKISQNPSLIEKANLAMAGIEEDFLIVVARLFVNAFSSEVAGCPIMSRKSATVVIDLFHKACREAVLDCALHKNGSRFIRLAKALKTMTDMTPADKVRYKLCSWAADPASPLLPLQKLAEKIGYSGNLEVFRRMAKAAGVKLFPRGRPKKPTTHPPSK